jgi:UDP-3-O-[3-hydroxymyristoyl] N-acetylglucosamine deacetylase
MAERPLLLDLIQVMDDGHHGMDQPRKQRTLAGIAAVEGVGYWSGQDVRVEFHPAPPHSGVVFVRGDLPGRPRIEAVVANRFEMPRRTALRRGEAAVEMVEHIMAALAGLQIDNCEIQVDQAEMPGCDGSCLPFVTALRQAGIVEQDAPRTLRMISRVIHLGNEESWIEARPGGAGRTVLQYELDYGSGSPIGRQSLEILLSPRFFHLNLAPSRTFLLEHEAAALRARGLGQRATLQDLLVFNADGPIDNQLRFPDECVRHKIVDLIGDLGLAGCDFGGHFVAYRSGHRLNAELVRTIVAETEVRQQQRRRCA